MPYDSNPNSLSTSVSRHDHHNIEIKAVFETTEQPFEGELDVYLFVPRSFDLRSWSKADLERDVRSRMRLAIPLDGERGLTALTRARDTFAAAVVEYLNNVSMNRSAVEAMLIETARDLCATMAETVKLWTAQQTRALLMAHTRLATENSCLNELDALRVCLLRTGELMCDIRSAARPAIDRAPALQAFDEYLSHLYVQYLGAIRSELDRSADAPHQIEASKYLETRKLLEKTLRKLVGNEAEYRSYSRWAPREEETDLAREQRILRMSYLKKYFQSRSFVEVSRRPALKRISESTALAGTAVAGFFWVFLQRFNNPTSVDTAFQSMFVIFFGVTAYVLRDRMKDWAKERFNQEARKFLPDYEQVLLARDQKIGEVKEWFNFREPATLNPKIQSLRTLASTNEIELRLPEDVFEYRKVQTMTPELRQEDNSVAVRALHENVRINFERYLKHMDDPFKEHIELDQNGQFRTSRAHRVYHFYLAVSTKARMLSPRRKKAISETSDMRLYRIVLDKTGVVRIENVENDRETALSAVQFSVSPRPTQQTAHQTAQAMAH